MPEETKNYVELTGDIVSAYVTANNMQRSELPGLIADVHMALTNLGKPASEPLKAEPPVPIKQTIKPDYIISLEDGRRYKSMKRHLSGRGLTPEQYREKWGLRPDYPSPDCRAEGRAGRRPPLRSALALWAPCGSIGCP